MGSSFVSKNKMKRRRHNDANLSMAKHKTKSKHAGTKKCVKKSRIELAPQDKQKLTAPIEDIFLKRIFGIDGALITDESHLSDFMQYSKDQAIRLGVKPGTMVFVRKIYTGPRMSFLDKRRRVESKKPENWKTEEFEIEPDPSMAEVVAKVREVFGVDISDICKDPLVEVLRYVAENYRPAKSKS